MNSTLILCYLLSVAFNNLESRNKNSIECLCSMLKGQVCVSHSGQGCSERNTEALGVLNTKGSLGRAKRLRQRQI